MYEEAKDGRGERGRHGRGGGRGRSGREGQSGRDGRAWRDARRESAEQDEVYRHVRTRLRELRQNVGMGVRTLSVLADVPETTLYEIESGRAAPTTTTLVALARVLGVGVSAFFE